MARSGKSIIIHYLSEAEIIAINEELVSQFGGIHGVRDLHILSSSVGRPQMSIGFQDAYKSIFDKSASLFHSIINNHPFLDGNKRTSLFCAILFLEYNKYSLKIKRKEAVKFTRKVVNENYSVEQISEWLKAHSVKIST
ncbi:MAG: type II toxin-antitoxin system death-on-curing family toxin [Candidatus Daviesbacteria bacterium]|nr:type II toxin-antitoxin system death-on-curing family toxin [Candidatus Daviesbacteria bacterium]